MHSTPLIVVLLFIVAVEHSNGSTRGIYLERDEFGQSNEGVYLEPEQEEDSRSIEDLEMAARELEGWIEMAERYMEEKEMAERKTEDSEMAERDMDMHDAGKLFDTLLSTGPGGCKKEGEKCRGFPKCCGKTVCYWQGKFNPLEQGTCVKCVKDGQRCVKDNQCCNGLQCDKDSRFYLNGWCRPPRPEGAKCHTDSMCNAFCQKSGFFNIYGTCMG